MRPNERRRVLVTAPTPRPARALLFVSERADGRGDSRLSSCSINTCLVPLASLLHRPPPPRAGARACARWRTARTHGSEAMTTIGSRRYARRDAGEASTRLARTKVRDEMGGTNGEEAYLSFRGIHLGARARPRADKTFCAAQARVDARLVERSAPRERARMSSFGWLGTIQFPSLRFEWPPRTPARPCVAAMFMSARFLSISPWSPGLVP